MAVGMGGAMLFYQVFVPLLLVATPSSSEEKFGLTGGSIVLQAEQVTRVSSIIWKHNKDKAAEWFDGDDAPTYYNIFTSVTTLDMQTWALNISNLQPHFSGKYSAEVNNKDPTQFVTLAVLGPVSKPEITMNCIDTEINCTLTCQGKEVEFTKYTWADDIDEWPGSELTVKRRDDDVVYTCNFSNPVSSASSPGTVKKFVPPPSPPSGAGTPIAVGVVVGFLLIAASIIGRLWHVLKRKGKGLTDLPTMSSQDRTDIWRSYISCNNGDENPPEVKTDGEASPTENGPRSTAKTSVVFIAEGEDKKPAETEPGPSQEGKPAEKSVVSTGSGENKEPDACEENQPLLITEDKKPAETHPDPAPEGKLPANGPGSTADEERKEGDGKEDNPHTMSNTEPISLDERL